MGQISLSIPQVGQSEATEEPKIASDLTILQTLVNGNIDTNNLSPTAGITAAQLASAVNQQGGVSDGTITRRGKSIVASTETRSNAAYGLMPTPDRVQSLVLPQDGLIAIAFQATWSETVTGAARAAIFIGANQLKGNGGSAVPIVQETTHDNTATQNQPLYSCAAGLRGNDPTGGWSDVTTGQIIGSIQSGTTFQYPAGPCYVFAAAGTYDVSVQFKASSGSVQVANRKLWVWTVGF